MPVVCQAGAPKPVTPVSYVTNTNTGSAANSYPITFTLDVIAGDYIIADVVEPSTGTAAVNWDSTGANTAMTALGFQACNNDTSLGGVFRFGIFAAASGTKTISFTCNLSKLLIIVGAGVYRHVGSQSTTGYYASADGMSIAQALTCPVGGYLVAGTANRWAAASTSSSGGTPRFAITLGDASMGYALCDSNASATLGATNANVTNFGMLATTLNAA